MFAISIGPWRGTHQRIDEWAMELMPDDAFPLLSSMMRYEGVGIQSPDGLSLFYKSKYSMTSSHYYNPETGEGGSIKMVRRYWRALVDELHQPYTRRAARAGAWMAHFAVDTLTPSHHVGYEVKPSPSLAPGAWYRDWNDPYWDPIPALLRLAGAHARFEAGVVLNTPLKYIPFDSIEGDLPRVRNEDEVQALLAHEAERVHRLGIYESFRASGWSPAISEALLRRVLPRQVALIAGLWVSAQVAYQAK